MAARTAHAQAAWEYSPYRVRVRLALEPVPQLPATLTPRLADSWPPALQPCSGAVWQVETLTAPPALRDEMLRGSEISPETIAAAVPDDLPGDKLYLAAITYREGGYHVAVRELDCRARQLSDAFERSAPDVSGLGPALWDAVLDAFTPLARIESVEVSRITARLRAGSLIVDPASRALVEKDMVLRPVIRRNDRSGQPAKGGIQVLPWTLLTVNERRDSLLDTTFNSAFRMAIPSRGSSRTERLALLRAAPLAQHAAGAAVAERCRQAAGRLRDPRESAGRRAANGAAGHDRRRRRGRAAPRRRPDAAPLCQKR